MVLAGSCGAGQVSSTLGNAHHDTSWCSKFAENEENLQDKTTTPSVQKESMCIMGTEYGLHALGNPDRLEQILGPAVQDVLRAVPQPSSFFCGGRVKYILQHHFLHKCILQG